MLAAIFFRIVALCIDAILGVVAALAFVFDLIRFAVRAIGAVMHQAASRSVTPAQPRTA